MARDRQRAKQRRAARLAEGSGTGADGSAERHSGAEAEELADLEVGAPPQDAGRSDTVTRHPPPAPDFGAPDGGGGAGDSAGGGGGGTGDSPGAGGGGGEGAEARPGSGARHGRLIAFLIAVWAELRRVQWPDRKQLTQLTGVVLFFVVIVGAYLGALDAVFSKVIQAIL